MREMLDKFVAKVQNLLYADNSNQSFANIRFEVTNVLVMKESMIIEGYFQNDGNQPARVTNLKLDISLLDELGEKIWHGIISCSDLAKNLIPPNQLSRHIFTISDLKIPEIKSKFTWLIDSETAQELNPIF